MELVVKIPASSFKILESLDKTLTTNIIEVFTNHITSQGWPFAYTDTIGITCRDIFTELSEPGLKAKLLYTILQVGVSHNRWRVMKILKSWSIQ